MVAHHLNFCDMKNRITNKLKMYNMVKIICAQNLSVWSNTPAFVEAHQLFIEKLTVLRDQLNVQETAVSGVTKSKQEVLGKVVVLALTTSKALSAYALKIGDTELLARNLYSRSEWFRGNAMLRVSRLTSLFHDATAHSSELEDYNIDSAFLAELQMRISDYNAVVQSPRVAILERKRATAALDRLSSEIDLVLTGQLDAIVESFRMNDAEFAEDYCNARIIMSLKGKRSSRASDHNSEDEKSSDDLENEEGYEEE